MDPPLSEGLIMMDSSLESVFNVSCSIVVRFGLWKNLILFSVLVNCPSKISVVTLSKFLSVFLVLSKSMGGLKVLVA